MTTNDTLLTLARLIFPADLLECFDIIKKLCDDLAELQKNLVEK